MDRYTAEISALIGGNYVDTETINDALNSWGAWSGTDEAEIRRMTGYNCQLGRLIKSSNRIVERTNDIKVRDLVAYYPESLYQKIDEKRKQMVMSEKNIMDARYRYRFKEKQILKFFDRGVYNRSLRAIHRLTAEAMAVRIAA